MDHRLIDALALLPAAAFAFFCWRALKTGTSGRGPLAVRREESPILFWSGIALFVVFFVGSVATGLGFVPG